MVFVVLFSLSPEDVDEAIEGLIGCHNSNSWGVSFVGPIKRVTFWANIGLLTGWAMQLWWCRQRLCDLFSAAYHGIKGLLKDGQMLRDAIYLWFTYSAVFFARHSLPYSQQNHSFSFEHPVHLAFEMRPWYFHVSDASHLCTKQRLTRSSPCGLFWSRLANGEVARLVRFSDLSWLVMTCQLFDRNKASTTLYTLVLHYRYIDIIIILSQFHRISWDVYTFEVRRSAYRHWRGTSAAIRCRMAPSCHLDPGTAGVYHGGNGHHKPYELHGWWRNHEAFEDIRES